MSGSSTPEPPSQPRVPPGPLHGPSPKDRRYDRQLRLWAAHGQAALESSHVLLINSGSGVVGVETLKNLVLPGLGSFTILDPATVSEEDLGVNFFLDEASLGRPRPDRASQLLGELNPDTKCYWIEDTVENYMNQPHHLRHFLKRYTVIVTVSPILSTTLAKISKYAQDYAVPLLHVHSVGFHSHFSAALPSIYPIVETHPPASATTDLRLLKPWPALTDYAARQTARLHRMNDHDHGHVPYVLLLLRYLEEWKLTHAWKPPQDYAEKMKFRRLVRAGTRTNNAEGGEENFDEAVDAVMKSLKPPSVPSHVLEMLSAKESRDLNKESDPFWVMVGALGAFHEKHGLLPLTASFPDMKARTGDYIELKMLYMAKTEEDIAEVTKTVRETEKKLGRENPIAKKSIEELCKNAPFIRLIRSHPLRVARIGSKVEWGDRAHFAYNKLADPTCILPLYVAFLAYDLFRDQDHAIERDGKLRKYPWTLLSSPGYLPESVCEDMEIMKSLARTILKDLWAEAGKDWDAEYKQEEHVPLAEKRVFDYIDDLVRAGGSELHNVSALTGGMVAQEIIKIITKQYVPIDNVCLYDGAASKIQELKL